MERRKLGSSARNRALYMSGPLLYLLLFCLGVAWGGTIPLTKIAVSTGHHPLGLIVWQLAMSVVVLAVLVKLRNSVIRFDRPALGYFLVIALVGTIFPNGFSYWSAAHIPAGVMALVIALVPMFALMIALVIRLEAFAWKRTGGVLLGAIAMALIVLPDTSLPDASKVGFVLIGLIAPFFYGVESNYVALKQPADLGPVATLLGASLLGLLIVFPMSLAVDGFINPMQEFGSAELALIGSTLLHVVAYVGYLGLVKIAGPIFTSQVAYVVTPAGVIFAILFLGEKPSPYLWAALIVLLVGLMLVQPKKIKA